MIATALINIAIIGAFTFLAIHFNKWWIVLFSALLMVKFEQKKMNVTDDDTADMRGESE